MDEHTTSETAYRKRHGGRGGGFVLPRLDFDRCHRSLPESAAGRSELDGGSDFNWKHRSGNEQWSGAAVTFSSLFQATATASASTPMSDGKTSDMCKDAPADYGEIISTQKHGQLYKIHENVAVYG